MEKKKTYTLKERTIDNYLQKSSKFLFPLLKIPGTKITPLQTYIAWEDEISIHEHKLICVYELREDNEFKNFERVMLLGNELFEDFKEGQNNKGIYIFNLTKFKDDLYHFLRGKYSKFDEPTKQIIIDFYKGNVVSTEYMRSYLYPEEYFEVYANLLNVSMETIMRSGELCNKYDQGKEKLASRILEPKI